MAQYSVEGNGDSIICWPVGPVCILVRVQGEKQSSLDVMQNQSLQVFHDYMCQCNRSIITERCYGSLLWHWHYCGRLQASWNSTLQQRKVEYICKYLTQLCSTVSEHAPQDASCFPCVDLCRVLVTSAGWITEELVELLCLWSTAVGQATTVILSSDVAKPLPRPVGIQVGEMILDFLPVGRFLPPWCPSLGLSWLCYTAACHQTTLSMQNFI